MKRYNKYGLAGCVEQRQCRATGALMGLYVADQAGIGDDPEAPWAAVCENHGTMVLVRTQRDARAAMSYPDWCDECAPLLEN